MKHKSTELTLTEAILKLETMKKNLERFTGYPDIRRIISTTYYEYVHFLDNYSLDKIKNDYLQWKLDYERRYPIETTPRRININLLEGNTIHSGEDPYEGLWGMEKKK